MPVAVDRPGLARRWALAGYRRMPRRLRLWAIRLAAPSHTLGAICVIEQDGRILMLRQRHRPGWTLPGGLVNRGETAAQAACREVAEETGLLVEVDLPVGTVVEPRTRRVDVIFHVPVDGQDQPEVTAGSEAVRAAWLRTDQLGAVDESTSQALELFARSRNLAGYRGRVLPAEPPPRAAAGGDPAPGPA